jgi:hypothetical protein
MTPLWLMPLLLSPLIGGKWIGTGRAQFRGKAPQACQFIGLSLAQDDLHFGVLAGGYECADLKASYDAYTLDIRGQGLWLGSAPFGTVDGDGIHVVSAHPDQNFTFYLDLIPRATPDGERLGYRERWISSDAVELEVDGELLPR